MITEKWKRLLDKIRKIKPLKPVDFTGLSIDIEDKDQYQRYIPCNNPANSEGTIWDKR